MKTNHNHEGSWRERATIVISTICETIDIVRNVITRQTSVIDDDGDYDKGGDDEDDDDEDATGEFARLARLNFAVHVWRGNNARTRATSKNIIS
jgi:hypothetical protein